MGIAKVVTVRDIEIEDGTVTVKGTDDASYRVLAKVESVVRCMSARELGHLLDQFANVNEKNMVVSFTRRDTREMQTAQGGDDSEPFMTPAGEKTDRRARLDRYGVAVEIDQDGELFVYHVTRNGAINPEAIKVTRPSPEFLAEVNQALGSSFTLDAFTASVVRGR